MRILPRFIEVIIDREPRDPETPRNKGDSA